ncbi:hypothetical protein DER46DRAFT_273743 [Fusarium sp. MPI-SDFR-AT-0072]|nr:hypothetical protein DER46DRAFT_273743 [Fusarium sp. MPI-SDFR-AT-0072]
MATNAASLATLGNSFIIQFHGGCSLGLYQNEADLSDLGLMFDVRFVLGFGSSMCFQGSSLGKFRYLGPAPATLAFVQGRYIMRALTISASPNQTILRYNPVCLKAPCSLFFVSCLSTYSHSTLILMLILLSNKPHSLPVCKRLCPSQHRGTQDPRAATCESNN